MGISTERIHYILHNELEVSKVCAKWVPHVLTEENKEKRVELSEQLLEILEKGFNNIVTGDEFWFHYFYSFKISFARCIFKLEGNDKQKNCKNFDVAS